MRLFVFAQHRYRWLITPNCGAVAALTVAKDEPLRTNA